MSNASAKNVNAPADIKKKSQFVEVWKRLCRNKTAVLGLVIVALLTLMAILSPILIDYETQVIKITARPSRRPVRTTGSERTRWAVTSYCVSCTVPPFPFPSEW